MSKKTLTLIEFARTVTPDHLSHLNYKSNHLLRLVRNVDLLLNDARILEANGGSNERILFLYLTAFEQLHVLLSRWDDAKVIPFGHKSNLAPLNGFIAQVKKIFGVDEGDVMTLRNSCLYEDEQFEAKYKLSKCIIHLSEFTPQLRSNCIEILMELDRRWNKSFRTYVDLGSDKSAYDSIYQKSKKK